MFNLYSIALFVHIVGALGMFTAIGIEWVCLLSLRQAAENNSIRNWLGIMSKLGKIHAPSWIVILISGIYMSAAAWGFQVWISFTLISILLMIILGALLSGERVRTLMEQLNKGGTFSDLQSRIKDKLLLYSVSLRTAIALEIILLMTIKPDIAGSIVSILTAVVIGLISVNLFSQQGMNKLSVENNKAVE